MQMSSRPKQSGVQQKTAAVDDLFIPSKEVPSQSNILGSPFVPPQNQLQPLIIKEEDQIPPPPKQEEEEQSIFPISKGMAIAICAIVIIVAIVGLIIYLIMHNRSQPKQKPKDGKQPSKEDEEEEEEPEEKEEEKKKKQQEAARLELQKTHVELEQYRKNDTILKSQLNQYSQLVRKLEHENEELRKATDTQRMIEAYRQQKGMPTENDFEDVPDKPKEGPKTNEEKTTKERRQELMTMVNQPRKTVADLQQEEADLKEANEQRIEQQDRAEIDDQTSAKIFVVDDEIDDERLIASVSSGK